MERVYFDDSDLNYLHSKKAEGFFQWLSFLNEKDTMSNENIDIFSPEWKWLLVGFLCAILNGLMMPAFAIIFGGFMESLGDDIENARLDLYIMNIDLQFKEIKCKRSSL